MSQACRNSALVKVTMENAAAAPRSALRCSIVSWEGLVGKPSRRPRSTHSVARWPSRARSVAAISGISPQENPKGRSILSQNWHKIDQLQTKTCFILQGSPYPTNHSPLQLKSRFYVHKRLARLTATSEVGAKMSGPGSG